MSTAAAKAKKSKSEPKLDSPGDVATTHAAMLETGKAGYKAADSALALLISQLEADPCPTCGGRRFKNDGIVKAEDGRRFRIVDKYASKIQVNVGMNARRYELEEIPA